MDILLALVAAFLFALGLVLQEKAASAVPDEGVGAGFLIGLVRRPVWVIGLAVLGLGYVAQAIALGVGRVVVVQPLLVSSIVFALPLGFFISHKRILRIEVIGAVLVAVSLFVLLVASSPSEGRDDAPLKDWLISGGVCLGIAALCWLAARGRRPNLRAGLLGIGGGVLFGFTAVLTKTTVSQLGDGVTDVLGHGHVYALIVISVAAFWLQQAALQTGALAAAVASSMAFDPLSSLVLGMTVVDERPDTAAWRIAVSVISLIGMLVGLVLLARGKGATAEDEVPAPAAHTGGPSALLQSLLGRREFPGRKPASADRAGPGTDRAGAGGGT
jgi:drug/metabolite transporter (DMT)-like permease